MSKRKGNQLPNNLPQLQNLVKRDPDSYREEVYFSLLISGLLNTWIEWKDPFVFICDLITLASLSMIMM